MAIDLIKGTDDIILVSALYYVALIYLATAAVVHSANECHTESHIQMDSCSQANTLILTFTSLKSDRQASLTGERFEQHWPHSPAAQGYYDY